MAKKKAESPVLFEKKTGSTAKPAAPAKPAAKAKAAPKPKAVKSAKPAGGGEEAKTPAKVKAPAAGKVAKAASGAPTAARAFSSEEIGLVAGDVWRVLSEDGTKTAAELTKAVAAPAELVAAALGWLARENKLAFETNGRSVKVSLL